MAGPELSTAAGRAWATALGCAPGLFGEPGAHLVPGGARLRGFAGVYLASIGPAVLVYCPAELRDRAAAVLAATPAGDLFTARTCAALAGLAGPAEPRVHGPSWHGFTDAAHFRPAVPAAGRRLDRADPLLAGLRAGCGEAEWAESGFADPDGVIYGIERDGRLAAAGNLTPFLGHPADVGLLTHPASRGRGLATRVAVRMVTDALPAAGLVRYRALASNAPSLAIARSLGFAGYGQNLVARLPGGCGRGWHRGRSEDARQRPSTRNRRSFSTWHAFWFEHVVVCPVCPARARAKWAGSEPRTPLITFTFHPLWSKSGIVNRFPWSHRMKSRRDVSPSEMWVCYVTGALAGAGCCVTGGLAGA